MDWQLQGMAQVTITLRSATTSVNNQGEPVYGDVTTKIVRLRGRREFVTGRDGQEVLSEQQIVSATEIKIDDQIWLPGESTGSDHPHTPQAVSTRYGEFGGVDHYKCFL